MTNNLQLTNSLIVSRGSSASVILFAGEWLLASESSLFITSFLDKSLEIRAAVLSFSSISVLLSPLTVTVCEPSYHLIGTSLDSNSLPSPPGNANFLRVNSNILLPIVAKNHKKLSKLVFLYYYEINCAISFAADSYFKN